ncbi:MAG: hypothetical protein ACUVRM_05955, partial [Bacillota bacterium]
LKTVRRGVRGLYFTDSGLVLSTQRTKTLPIAIYNFVSYAEINWGNVMAAAVVIIMPAIILTMIFQKYVIKGWTIGAVKG